MGKLPNESKVHFFLNDDEQNFLPLSFFSQDLGRETPKWLIMGGGNCRVRSLQRNYNPVLTLKVPVTPQLRPQPSEGLEHRSRPSKGRSHRGCPHAENHRQLRFLQLIVLVPQTGPCFHVNPAVFDIQIHLAGCFRVMSKILEDSRKERKWRWTGSGSPPLLEATAQPPRIPQGQSASAVLGVECK